VSAARGARADVYYAVIFTSDLRGSDPEYAEMAQRMLALASDRPGFLGFETARGKDGPGISVSYWRDLSAIAAWRRDSEHSVAQRLGREKWYSWYRVRVARVEREYEWTSDAAAPDTGNAWQSVR
jgi:heme-degrading monooxygenase HmoA